MAQPYLDQLRSIVDSVDLNLRSKDLQCKHFFSGAALYLEGKICASLTPKGLGLKLSPARREELLADGTAKILRYFEKAPVKKEYVLFARYDTLGESELAVYLNEALAFVKHGSPE